MEKERRSKIIGESPEDEKIRIVGGGAAGLMATLYLVSADFSPTLYMVTYLSIVVPSLFVLMSRFALISLLNIPLMLKAVKAVRSNYKSVKGLIPAMSGTIAILFSVGTLLSIGYRLQRICRGTCIIFSLP